jgi:hypothetical protein
MVMGNILALSIRMISRRQRQAVRTLLIAFMSIIIAERKTLTESEMAMKAICGHCGVTVNESLETKHLGNFAFDDRLAAGFELPLNDPAVAISSMRCPHCNKLTAYLGLMSAMDRQPFIAEKDRVLVHPIVKTARKHPSNDVGKEFANDFWEACLVLNDSPKASAALSRRCLQNVLRHKVGIKKGTLYDEIEEWIKVGRLPSDLDKALHMVRDFGNFAAHASKSLHTGEIIDVEPGEADWCLETLEMVFDHCFVKPAEMQRRIAALDAKKTEAKKTPA